ncbi:MAG TPA: penicillin-insensitive murein endopeptidase [Kofleriaceae bacterium]|jgi:murein endopeptidase|nr:penicillin-insensitive murein endopeptidase [Kofleriaceae bacterium]
MRALVGLASLVALGLLAFPIAAHASPRNARDGKDGKAGKDARDRKPGRSRHRATATDDRKTKQRAARLRTPREHERFELRLIGHGQSFGAPWAGRLLHATALPPGDGYVLRRPERAYGTQTTIELTERAIRDTLDAFPDEHVLAIGDISAPSGGTITQHRSHQSGRDIDVGLFYLEKPAGYPASFIHADEDNLDCAATFKLLESFLATTDDDGGVQMVFLDFEVQGILYNWALDNGVSERRLDRIFQYPHGRGSSEGIVRHEPNHDNHMHVRFKCPADDTGCR